MKMTFHANVERMDRIEYIFNTVGFGEPYMRFESFNNRKVILTTTGICLVVDPAETVLITAYFPKQEEITFLYKHLNFDVPSTVKVMMKRNRKFREAQP